MFKIETSKSSYSTGNLGRNEGKVINIRKYLHFVPKIINLCNRNDLEIKKRSLKDGQSNTCLSTPPSAYEDMMN